LRLRPETIPSPLALQDMAGGGAMRGSRRTDWLPEIRDSHQFAQIGDCHEFPRRALSQ